MFLIGKSKNEAKIRGPQYCLAWQSHAVPCASYVLRLGCSWVLGLTLHNDILMWSYEL